MDFKKVIVSKTLDVIKQLSINIDDFRPNITVSSSSDSNLTINNMASLFRRNAKDKIMNSLNLICEELQKNSDNIYTVTFSNLYLNFSLNKEILYRYIDDMIHYTIPLKNKKKILVDYSSPNIAKDMHVGHLRSTIIGDCLANLFEAQGHEVLRINHIGNFGLPIGIIIQYIISENLSEKLLQNELTLQEIYIKAKKLFETDKEFNKLSYENTVKLQNNNNDNKNEDIIKIWTSICNISRQEYDKIYNKLGINLIECAESFYQKYISDVIEKLKNNNLLYNDNGRLIVNTIHGILTIVKEDGGYTYDTTDVTALWYRLCVLNMDKIYYVVDSGQSLHFMQLFEVAKMMGWLTNQHIEHINFGAVCGIDGKKIRSRNGDTIKLIDLLDYSIEETNKVISNKINNKINNEESVKIIAYGSIKYSDLSVNRMNDYKFSFERMLNFKDNTLLYVMYARVRIVAVLKKLPELPQLMEINNSLNYQELNKYDYELIFHLTTFNDIISKAESGWPHYLCIWLYNLADMLHNCYNKNRCIEFNNSIIISINKSRIKLYSAMLHMIDICFKILNIGTVDKL